ncbi:MAG: diacylglycerol kinase family protein [Candidatus Sericytochromatia bacterium]
MSLTVIMNPTSARGRTRRQWPELGKILAAQAGPYTLRETTGPGTATELTRQALRQGADWILAVGGDGTLNEVLNGFFDGEALINPEARLSVLMSGTGGDFKRTLELSPEPEKALGQMLAREPRKLDIGRLRLIGNDGKPALRHFINIASFGVGGEVSVRLNESKLAARLGGKPGFMVATLETLATFRPKPIKLTLEGPKGPFTLQGKIRQVAVANGRYHGGGMHMAPRAKPDDGLFEVIALEDHGLLHSLTSFGKVYKGEHLDDPKILYLQATRVAAEPLEGATVLLEVDGETPGRLPASFEILPGAIWFQG